MLKKYDEFVYESLDFLLESNIEFSNNFKSILSRINDPLSNKILSLSGKDLDITSNYIDIDKDKNDIVSFIPDRRAQQILGDYVIKYRFIGQGGGWLRHSINNKSIFEILGYDWSKDLYVPSHDDLGVEVSRYTTPTTNRTYLYIKFDNGNESIININKLRRVDNNIVNDLWNQGRQEIKIGRLVRSILMSANISFTAKEIEDFVNNYKAAIDKHNDKFSLFEEVSGDDIVKWYEDENYYSYNGTLGSSCMAGAGNDILELYSDNENISMLIYKSSDNENKILGRAILWKLVGGERFLDRIYTANDSDVTLFREYAKEYGIYTKAYNNSSAINTVIAPDLSQQKLNLTCEVKKGLDNFPYMDTLKYYCPNTGLISYEIDVARNNSDVFDVYECESTEGGYSDVY